jgi:hypothetical protein
VPLFIAVLTSYLLVCGSGLFRALADRGESAAADRLKAQQLAKEQRAASLAAANASASDTDSNTQSNPMRSDSNTTDYDPRAFGTSAFMRPTGHQPAPRASDASQENLTTV